MFKPERSHMELNSFARIGKGVISKSIGLQKNYKEVITQNTDVLNERKSMCESCPIRKLKEDLRLLGLTEEADKIHKKCRECSSSVWEPSYTVHYVNEKNRYGYQPTLKANAIKLLLLYHFLQPDGNGFIKNVSIKALAEKIGCTTATIRASNQVLADYNYCYTCESGMFDHHINVFLPEYKNYHKTAAEGGRGYITMSSEMLLALLDIRSLNPLRLNLKGILTIDSTAAGKSGCTAETSFSQLRGFLPQYCKNNVIRKALQQDGSILDSTFTEKRVSLSIREEFSQRSMRSSMKKAHETSLIDFVSNMNDVLEAADSAAIPSEKEQFEDILATMNIRKRSKYPLLTIRLEDYSDLAALSLQYNLAIVKSVIVRIYNHYIANNENVERFGALARTLIRNSSYAQTAC